jgi:hypothetical protein
MRTGYANLPLHGGRAPRWLFQRMTLLAREVARWVAEERGPQELLVRLSDPFWFQAFGCVLGFDWHSSGLTTTTCGALKEALRGLDKELGVFVAGGKGAVSRRTPDEILEKADKHGIAADPENLIYASRMSAKVDSSAVQDGYQVYHHCFIFTPRGDWAVVQQGMNEQTSLARRYHWLSSSLESFINEPHAAVCSDSFGLPVLNLVAHESEEARKVSTFLAGLPPDRITSHLKGLRELSLPRQHEVTLSEINPERMEKIFLKTYERQPENFEALLGMQGVGSKTLRALSLIAELVHGVPTSLRDPARFSFAHGGKDGHPYPVDRDTYDRSIQLLHTAIEKAKLGDRERLDALRRLGEFGARRAGRGNGYRHGGG